MKVKPFFDQLKILALLYDVKAISLLDVFLYIFLYLLRRENYTVSVRISVFMETIPILLVENSIRFFCAICESVFVIVRTSQ